MRRKLGYILLTSTLLLGAAALVGPTLLKLNTDITYGAGKDLVFKISEKDSTYNGVFQENYVVDDGSAVALVGEEFEARLKDWDIEADVIKEGTDTIRVRVRSEKDEIEYRYLESYLPFSGGYISVGASLDTKEDYDYKDSYAKMFDDQEARIEYIKVSTGEVPAVVIPVNEPGKDGDFASLIEFCNRNNHEADEENNIEASTCYLVLWSHKQEVDTYAKAAGGDESDPNVSKRLIFAEDASQAWFDADKDEDDYKEFQLIPSSSALTEKGFDPSKASEAYMAALYYKSLLNASDYADIGGGYDVTFAFETDVDATVEPLTVAGAWSRHPALKATAIASLIAIVFSAALLIAYYRLGALAILSSMAFTLMGDLLLFSVFNAQFGVGAVIGIMISLLVSAFGGMYYFTRFKEQLYQGRSTKKAHIEAAKRSVWPTVDASVLSIIIGVCVYGFVPSVAGKIGLMMAIGGFFAGLYNLIFVRLAGYFLANDDKVAKAPARVYNVNAEKIPNLAAEEKPTFFGNFANKDFKKPFKGLGIAAAALVVASIIGVSIFSSLKNTDSFNYSTRYDDMTVSYVEYRSEQGEVLPVTNETQFQTEILDKIMIGEKAIGVESIKLEDSTVYDSVEERTRDVHYYYIEWSDNYTAAADYDFAVTAGGVTTHFNTLQDALTFAVGTILPAEDTVVSVAQVTGTVGDPSLGRVWLGLGVGLAITTAYLAIRHRLSRGLTAGVLSAGAAVLTTGLFALTRIQVPALAAVGTIVTAVVTLLAALFILNKEKELYRDSREKDKDNLEFRTRCITAANSQSVEDIVMLAFLSFGGALIFFGIGPRVWSLVHVGAMFGVICAVVLVLFILTPVSAEAAKRFGQLARTLKPAKKEAPAKPTGRRGSEPEEATFIGIND